MEKFYMRDQPFTGKPNLDEAAKLHSFVQDLGS